MLLRNTAIISTRDVISKQILQPLTGALAKPITVTGDSALTLGPVEAEAKADHVLFCPRRLNENHRVLYHQGLDRVKINRIRHMQAIAADRLIDEGYRVSFLPFHCVAPDNDLEETRVIMNLMRNTPDILPHPEDVDEALNLIGGAVLVVGLRLHSLIFAAIQSTPIVSVDYDIKIRGFMGHMNLSQLLTETDMGLTRLSDKSIQALKQKEAISANLRKRVITVKSLINLEADRMVDLLRKGNGDSSSSRLQRDRRNR
jgi:polysaccharide pyruvyl transferase WcaK-like protein